MSENPIKVSKRPSFFWLVLCLCIGLNLSVVELISQSEHGPIQSSTAPEDAVEMAIDLSKQTALSSFKTMKLRIGDRVRVKTWGNQKFKGQITGFKEDSLAISGTWISVYFIERIYGEFTYQGEGLGAVLAGSAAIAGGIGIGAIVLNNLMDDVNSQNWPTMVFIVIPTVFIAFATIVVYGGASILGGLIEALGARHLYLGRFQKSIHYHDEAEMMAKMKKRERRKYQESKGILNSPR